MVYSRYADSDSTWVREITASVSLNRKWIIVPKRDDAMKLAHSKHSLHPSDEEQWDVLSSLARARMGTFFTLGHSNHSVEKWLDLVRLHAIEVVVDTRSSPFSKYVPQFDRELMQSSLEGAGLRYLFLGAELGGRPANENYYDASGRVVYGRLRDDAKFRAAIVRLETGIPRYRVALVCGEEDPAHCHRRLLIGRVLSERGHTMLHIRGDGRLETDEAIVAASGKALVEEQPALFAELDEDKWRSTASVLPRKVPANSSPR